MKRISNVEGHVFYLFYKIIEKLSEAKPPLVILRSIFDIHYSFFYSYLAQKK